MIAPNSSASAHEVGQRTEVAVHREHAVGDQDLALRGRQLLEDLARGVDVLVRKHLDRRAAQPAAVDDARVIQLIGDDDVVLGEDGRDGAGVGGEAALKHHDGLDVLELGEAALELHVHLHRAGDRAHRARADAVLADGVERGLAQLRVRGEAEIVVRRQVDHRLVVERRVRRGLAFEDAQLAVEALLLQVVEFDGKKRKRIWSHGKQCRVKSSSS